MIPTSVELLTVVVGLLELGKELVLPVIVVFTDDSVAVMMLVKIVGALDPI